MTIPSNDELVKIIEERFSSRLALYIEESGRKPSDTARQFLLGLFCAGVDLGVELCISTDSKTTTTKH
jgi:hypothetical protein